MKYAQYESVVIINAALEDEHVDSTVARLREVITSHGGEIAAVDKWGRKRLAYPIKKAKSGYYVVYRFKAPTDLIAVLERNYRLDENIFRYLTISLNKFALEAIAKQKESSKAVESAAAEDQTKPNESKE
ncbi:MAG: 30S ribosomal protein S6 [Ignavibacteriales bacterium]|nr:30S ribosomal protein S6 [Ignavibacteriales bacterium]